MALMLKHVTAPIPALELPPGVVVPPALPDLVQTLLAKDPDQRPHFAADVRRALRALDWSVARDATRSALQKSESAASHPTQPERRTLPLTPGLRPAPPSAATSSPAPDVLTDSSCPDTSGLMQTIFDGVDVDGPELPLAPGLFGTREVPFVGRRSEREALWSELERTLNGRNTRIVALTGELGVGKSRLARWLAERAEEEGLMQAIGCGIGPGAVLPAGGLLSLIERHLRVVGCDAAGCRRALQRQLVDKGHFEPSELGPLLHFLRPTEEARSLHRRYAVDPAALVARLLRAAVQTRPVLLWFDDLTGSAMAPFLELLDLLLATRNLAPMPVLVVVTLDDPGGPFDELADVHPRDRHRLRELLDSGVQAHLRLQRMPSDDATALARSILPIGDHLAEVVAERSGGNPQFAIQLLSHWMDRGELEESGSGLLELRDFTGNLGKLPRGLAELLQTRLGTLLVETPSPVKAREVLGRAALAGRRFSLMLLEHLVEREGRPDLVPHLDAVAERMIAEDFWIEVGNGQMQFARADMHELAREHLMRPVEAVRIAGLLADIKLDLHADDLAPHRLAIAEHFVQAGLYDRACIVLLAAADQALVWADYSGARDAFMQVRTLLGHHSLTDAANLADDVDLGLAYCALHTGEYEDVDRFVDAVEQRMRATARRRALANAALLRAEVTHKRGLLEEAAALFGSARAAFLDIHDIAGSTRALRGMAEVFASRGQPDLAGDAASTALTTLASLNDPLEAARCLMIQGKVARIAGRLDDALQLYAHAQETFVRAGARHGLLEAKQLIGDLLTYQRRFEDAWSLFDEVLELVGELGDLSRAVVVFRARGQIARRLGRTEESRAAYERSLGLAAQIGDELGAGRAYNGLGELARSQGALEEALRHYEGYVTMSTRCGANADVAVGTANLALVNLELGRWADAQTRFEEAAGHAQLIGSRRMQGAFIACLARARAEQGLWSAVASAVDEALAIDAHASISEPDFVASLKRVAELAAGAQPALARRVAEAVGRRARERADHELVAWSSALLLALA